MSLGAGRVRAIIIVLNVRGLGGSVGEMNIRKKYPSSAKLDSSQAGILAAESRTDASMIRRKSPIESGDLCLGGFSCAPLQCQVLARTLNLLVAQRSQKLKRERAQVILI